MRPKTEAQKKTVEPINHTCPHPRETTSLRRNHPGIRRSLIRSKNCQDRFSKRNTIPLRSGMLILPSHNSATYSDPPLFGRNSICLNDLVASCRFVNPTTYSISVDPKEMTKSNIPISFVTYYSSGSPTFEPTAAPGREGAHRGG